ncbi:MAG: beta strand repeat-containing protein, partial [Minisyncoccia bacterium]
TFLTMSGQTPVSGYVLTASDSAGDTTWTAAGSVSGWTVSGNNVYETLSGNVGIGTTALQTALAVTNGNVGIGTWAPAALLEVNGDINLSVGASRTIKVTQAAAGVRGSNLNIIAGQGLGGGNLYLAGGSPSGGSAGNTILANTGTVSQGNVGIGTITPVAQLAIAGNVGIGTNLNSSFVTTTPPNGGMIVESNVGIGSINPGQKLDVTGTVRTTFFTMSGQTPVAGYVLSASDSAGDATWVSVSAAGGWTVNGNNVYETSGGNVGIGTTLITTSALTVMNGNVGIGTWVPAQSLEVKGTVLMTGFQLNNSPVAGDILMTNAVGVGTWIPASAVSTPTPPGGAGTELQYRNGGSFAAVTNSAVSSNGNVGFGTTLSANKLDIQGGVGIGTSYAGYSSAPANGMIVQGNVGIGSTTPGQKLDVTGTVRTQFFTMSGQTPVAGYVLSASDSAGDATWVSVSAAGGWTVNGNNVYETSGGNVGIGTTLVTTSALTVMNGNVGIGTWKPIGALDIKTGTNVLIESGNVGIGSLNPAQALDVTGTVRTTFL